MTEAQMKSLARRWFEEVWNQRSEAAINTLMAEDALGYLETGPADRNQFKEMHRQLCGAFGDLSVELEQLAVADGEVAVRWHLTGTHDGDGLKIAPTKQAIDYRGTTWLTMANGKITGGFDTWNMGQLMAELSS